MRILLVEDDTDVARFIGKGLMEQAYAIDVAQDGEEALYLAGVNTYDVIILDVMIPSPDGLEVCRRLRAGKSTVEILMLAGATRSTTRSPASTPARMKRDHGAPACRSETSTPSIS